MAAAGSSLRMRVVKRDGRVQDVHFDKITERISRLCAQDPPLVGVDPVVIAQQVIQGVRDGITTTELDRLAAETAAYQSTRHPDFGALAARIQVSNLHKSTPGEVVALAELLRGNMNFEGPAPTPAPLLSEAVHGAMVAHAAALNAMLNYDRDYDFDYFGIRTLERSYLMRVNTADGASPRIVERPQDMFLRVALGIHVDPAAPAEDLDLDAVRTTYELMSKRMYTHATPTLFNAGTMRPQMSSCFLMTIKGDSIEGIFDTAKDTALISKYAGGIGLSVHTIRAQGAYIAGTNGHSNGLVPMLRIFNDIARYVDQGGGKRKGSFAIYLEPWHADIEEFLELKKNTGKDEARARDLFYAMWVPDLFMQRVLEDKPWSLFCPNTARLEDGTPLCDLHGEEFKRAYEALEAAGRARRTVRAQELFNRILIAQIETGTPYMLYKDHINAKSNQANLGTIRSSNLCAEIVEYSGPGEVAVCNLASINLSACVRRGGGAGEAKPSTDGPSTGAATPPSFDYDLLHQVAKVAVRNLNKVIDRNYYPIPETRASNMRHRPIGLGVQGLADAFAMLRLPFDSDGAREVNRLIFETIYHAAVESSCDVAETDGTYESWKGSPASEGRLQFDLWGVTPSDRYDWAALRERVMRVGLRNSLLVALMPTASTSQILGNNEAFEPFTSNIYTRRTLAGEFMVVNKHLVEDLAERGLWSEALRQQIIAAGGSVQGIAAIPEDIRALYKTAWDMKQRVILDMAADRGPFVDQTQSMNVFLANPTVESLSSMHMYGWRRGLKTGMYYLRTKAAIGAVKFTIDHKVAAGAGAGAGAGDDPACESCSA